MSLTAHKKSFDNGVQVVWDATSLDLASACPRKYFYRMIRGLRPKEASVHLLFGGIYASALEHFYKHRALGLSVNEALREVVREAMIASWDADAGLPKTFDDPKKTRIALLRTIIWYVEQFANETQDGLRTYHLTDGKPAVELSFSLEFAPSIVYCGHLDRVVQMGDELYVMDQKTTGGTVGPYYFNTFAPSNQMSGYAFAGQVILKSPVRGVIIDAAQIAVNYTRFERGITSRSKDQLEEWFASTVWSIQSFQYLSEMAGENEQKWPMNPTACSNYGGCEFRNLCSRSPKVRENFIKSDFVPHNWDPAVPR